MYYYNNCVIYVCFFFQAEDGIRDGRVTGVQTCALPIYWLPPDFGAVGQYAVLFARQWAREGWAVTLVGLTSGPSNRQAAEPVGDGSLEVLRVHRHTYKKQKFVRRLVWTVVSNILLLSAAF